MKTIYANQNQSLDEICNQYYGQTAGVVEWVLDYNPHLDSLDPNLPEGTPVYLPETPPSEPTKKTINLWD